MSNLIQTHAFDGKVIRRIWDAAAKGNIRRVEIDSDGDIVALIEEPGHIGNLTTGIRQETLLQPVVLVSRKERRDWPHATLDVIQAAVSEAGQAPSTNGKYLDDHAF